MGKAKQRVRRFGRPTGRHSYLNRQLRRSLQQLGESQRIAQHKETFLTCRHTGDGKLLIKAHTEPPSANRDGYRIIHLGQLNTTLHVITRHVGICDQARHLLAHGADCVKLIGSSKDRGLACTLTVVCLGCTSKFNCETSPKLSTPDGGSHYDINVRGVWGQMTTGGGCAKLSEAMATMGCPSVSATLFTCLEDQIGQWWRQMLHSDMESAACEERQLACDSGSFHEGVPAITVICDGGWSKRSHKHSYNALGGVGIVIGKSTGKLLHVGVRNKICSVCLYADTHNITVRPHTCYKNWHASSQAMESDIILEAFSEAEQRYGLRYMKAVADGDSSMLATLRDRGPSWCRQVEKVECANHAVKCLRGSLEKIVSDHPEFKGANGLTKTVRVRLTSIVRCSIRLRSRELDRTSATHKLRGDILNSLDHVFGHHGRCSADVCRVKSNSTHPVAAPPSGRVHSRKKDEDPVLQCVTAAADQWRQGSTHAEEEEARCDRQGGKLEVKKELRAAAQIPLNRLAQKADKLIGNTTTNLAEAWMSLRAKFDGGKFVNRCARGSWAARCYGAALRSNLGVNWSAQTWEEVTGTPATTLLHKFGERMSYKRLADKMSAGREAVAARSRKRKLERERQDSSKKAKRAYGPDVELECSDLTAVELQEKCERFYKDSVICSAQQCVKLEQETRGQADSAEWHVMRRLRLTASNFGDVLSKKPSTKLKLTVERLLYSTFSGTAATTYGLQQERATRQEYELLKSTPSVDTTVTACGLWVNPKWPFLGASPDGLVHVNGKAEGLVEYKNVLRNKPITLLDACKLPGFCLECVDGKLQLKATHKYAAQCQGLLQVCQLPWLDLVVRSLNPYQMHVQRIHKDDELWQTQMLTKLEAFFFHVLLPELSAPRHGLLPGIREPGQDWAARKVPPYAPSRQHAQGSDRQAVTRQSTRLRSTQPRFVGRRIRHQWIEDEDNDIRCWYEGTVVRVRRGRDGQPNADYEVQYDGEDGSHYVDHIVEDYQSGALTFL